MRLLVDTSVIVTWFSEEGGPTCRRLGPARRAGGAPRRPGGERPGAYALGNVLLRRRRWPAVAVSAALEAVDALVETVPVRPSTFAHAATLAVEHTLSCYDACWVAAAHQLEVPLVTADRKLLTAGLAESTSAAAARLRSAPPGRA